MTERGTAGFSKIEMTKLLAPLTLALLLGCDGPSQLAAVPNCTDELRLRWTPADTTVDVGAKFAAAISLSTCGGNVHLSDRVTWASSDTTVATVETVPIGLGGSNARGLVTTRAAGVAYIIATGAKYHTLWGPKVTVR